MSQGTVRSAASMLLLLTAGPPALSCDLCGASKRTITLPQSAQAAKLVLYGKLANARVNPDNDGGGATDLHIEKVLKSDPWLGDKKIVELQRYVRIDPADDYFLVFCDIFKGKLDAYRGEPVGLEVVDYLQKAMTLKDGDRVKTLLFFFNYLDHRNTKISSDAFAQFARSSDVEIAQVAGKLPPVKLRRWLQDSKTPPERLSLYAFLLSACGTEKDADLLRSLIDKSSERTSDVLAGSLSGYIRLRPRAGWDLAATILQDAHRSFVERYAVVGMLRFYHAWKPDETRDDVLRCLGLLVRQGEMADIAIEDLRLWEAWSACPEVLAQFDRKTHAAPIVRRAIVRYALCCPEPSAKAFIADLRRKEPSLVSDVEESLSFERQR